MEFEHCHICGAEIIVPQDHPEVGFWLRNATPEQCLEWHGGDPECRRRAELAHELLGMLT